MVIHSRELHRTANGAANDAEDWWRIVFDEERESVFVEHEWAHLDLRQPLAKVNNGSEHYTLEDFLIRTHAGSPGAQAAKQQLVEAVRLMFRP